MGYVLIKPSSTDFDRLEGVFFLTQREIEVFSVKNTTAL